MKVFGSIQIVLTERKTSLINIFPQLLKIIEKKAWNFRKLEGKARKSTNENNAICLSFIGFFTQSSQYQILKANTYSILTNGNRTWTASVGVLN